MANKIKLARGLKSKIEAVKPNLEDYEIVYSYDTKEIGIKTGAELVWYPNVTNLSNKVDKVSGKGLSTNDYTTAEKSKLAGIFANAEKNRAIATKAEAEAGTHNARSMTPLRTKEAIEKALINSGGNWELLTFEGGIDYSEHAVVLTQFKNSGWKIFAVTFTTYGDLAGTFIIDTSLNRDMVETKTWVQSEYSLEDNQYTTVYYRPNYKTVSLTASGADGYDLIEVAIWGVSK